MNVNLTEEQYKTLLVDAICNHSPGASCEEAHELEKLGFAKFTGNQWNPDWAWKSDALHKMNISDLENLYKNYLPHS